MIKRAIDEPKIGLFDPSQHLEQSRIKPFGHPELFWREAWKTIVTEDLEPTRITIAIDCWMVNAKRVQLRFTFGTVPHCRTPL